MEPSAKIPRLIDHGLSSITSIPNHTFKLHARLTFKIAKNNSNETGVNYQLTNWIDGKGIEFLGQSWGEIAFRLNHELQEDCIYSITNAVVSSTNEKNSRFLKGNGLTLNSKTKIERLYENEADLANFPKLPMYKYKNLEEILSLDRTFEQRIDFIGIFSEWIDETQSTMSLITPEGKLIINVENAISQVPHEDYIRMDITDKYSLTDTTVSFKELKMDGENFYCYIDTVIKINRYCEENDHLKYWVNFVWDEGNPSTNDESDSNDSGVFYRNKRPNPEMGRPFE